MLFSYMFAVVIIILPSKSAILPIRHVTIDLLYQHGYVVSDITYQIGRGITVSNLDLCIYACHNHDFCRTAVFDSQLLVCSLFEECSNRGQIVSAASATLISFILCDGEPESMAFIHPLNTPIPLQAVMSNLRWIKDLVGLSSWFPFFVNDQFYVPLSNVINIYETDTYTLVRRIQIPVTARIHFIRGDSQGTFIYSQDNDPKIYIYSLSLNVVTQVTSSWTNFKICYSTSFIVITSWSSSVADVYLRSITNNSAIFLYRIGGWSQLLNCAIINDQQLIGASSSGGLKTTKLSRTNYNSTVNILPLSTSYLPTGAMITMDTAGRIYAAPAARVSTVFLSNGTLIGVHNGTADSVGKASKYKLIFVATNGNKLSVFEYSP